MISRNISPLGLAVLALLAFADALALVFAARGLDYAPPPAEPAPRWRPPFVDDRAPLRAQPDDSFAQTLGRPLFSPSRSPYSAPAVSAPDPAGTQAATRPAPAPPRAMNFEIVGLMITTQAQKALVLSSDTKAVRWIGLGDRLGDWTVSVIDSKGLSVTADQTTQRIDLYPQGK